MTIHVMDNKLTNSKELECSMSLAIYLNKIGSTVHKVGEILNGEDIKSYPELHLELMFYTLTKKSVDVDTLITDCRVNPYSDIINGISSCETKNNFERVLMINQLRREDLWAMIRY